MKTRFNFRTIRLPTLDFQTVLLFFLTVGYLVNSMALYYKEHYPWIVLYNPMTNVAKLMKATRDEQAVRDVMLGGFRQAVAVAVGAHPFEMDRPGHYAVKDEILKQMFSPEAAKYVLKMRQEIAIFHVYGTTELTFNSEHLEDIFVRPTNGGLFFESYFNQVIPIKDNKKRIRTFHVRGFGYLAPGTIDNPYQIKFAELQIKEIEPKKPQ
ncbi:hypothetical protein [Acanthopleuribacter pedis]|uniref:Uncharacterized protein n=1 Tax=Acanthopleuribacter pedis TaxID=442870 RepID=A0A8J7QEV7_9BACT|nr:hypothetical protein [Acanthopleuribacter pedis]MBO1323397.1 hypothetical protein [Acanthopleuribacter pedis]